MTEFSKIKVGKFTTHAEHNWLNRQTRKPTQKMALERTIPGREKPHCQNLWPRSTHLLHAKLQNEKRRHRQYWQENLQILLEQIISFHLHAIYVCDNTFTFNKYLSLWTFICVISNKPPVLVLNMTTKIWILAYALQSAECKQLQSIQIKFKHPRITVNL